MYIHTQTHTHTCIYTYIHGHLSDHSSGHQALEPSDNKRQIHNQNRGHGRCTHTETTLLCPGTCLHHDWDAQLQYVYIHTYIHTYIHIYIHTYIARMLKQHCCVPELASTMIRTPNYSTRTYIQICMYAHTYIYVCICTTWFGLGCFVYV